MYNNFERAALIKNASLIPIIGASVFFVFWLKLLCGLTRGRNFSNIFSNTVNVLSEKLKKSDFVLALSPTKLICTVRLSASQFSWNLKKFKNNVHQSFLIWYTHYNYILALSQYIIFNMYKVHIKYNLNFYWLYAQCTYKVIFVFCALYIVRRHYRSLFGIFWSQNASKRLYLVDVKDPN